MSKKATPGGTVAVHDASDAPGFGAEVLKRFRWLRALAVCLTVTACGETTVQVEDPDPIELQSALIEIVAGDDQEGTVGADTPEPLTVVVRDQNGDPLAGAAVWWTFSQGRGRGASQGGSTASTSVQLVTDSQGLSSVDWELGTRAGVQTASAELDPPAPSTLFGSPSLAPKRDSPGRKVGFRSSAKAAKADQIVVSADTLMLSTGDRITLQATVLDRYGNVIPDAVVTWSSVDPSVASVSTPQPVALPAVRISEQ